MFFMNNRPKKKCLANVEYTESSGSVFADLGIPNPEKSMVKAQIAMKIHEIIKKKRLSQKDAVQILGISQPKISIMHRGH